MIPAKWKIQKNASDCRMTADGGVFVPNYVKC